MNYHMCVACVCVKQEHRAKIPTHRDFFSSNVELKSNNTTIYLEISQLHHQLYLRRYVLPTLCRYSLPCKREESDVFHNMTICFLTHGAYKWNANILNIIWITVSLSTLNQFFNLQLYSNMQKIIQLPTISWITSSIIIYLIFISKNQLKIILFPPVQLQYIRILKNE